MAHPDLAFVLLLIGAATGLWARGHISKERLESLGSQLAGETRLGERYQREIAELKAELASVRAATPEAPPFGPDDVVQRGVRVGEVIGLAMQLHDGTATASELRADGQFNPEHPFNLRGYKMLLVDFGARGKISEGRRLISQTYADAVCRIIPE